MIRPLPLTTALLLIAVQAPAGAVDFLEPIRAYDPMGVLGVLTAGLNEDTRGFQRFAVIEVPSTGRPWAISLSEGSSPDGTRDAGTFFLTKVEFHIPISELFDFCDGKTSIADCLAKSRRTKAETIVDVTTARGIIDTAREVLLRSKYGGEITLPLDGADYFFISEKKFLGHTWSPQEGLPFRMVRVGTLLKSLVSDPGDHAETVLAEVRALCAAIREEIEGEVCRDAPRQIGRIQPSRFAN